MKTNTASVQAPSLHANAIQGFADVIVALLRKDPALAETLLAAAREARVAPPSGIFSTPPQPPPTPVLADPDYEAAEADVTVAKEMLQAAIQRRSDILRSIKSTRGAGPYKTDAGLQQIVSRTSSLGVTYFLRLVTRD